MHSNQTQKYFVKLVKNAPNLTNREKLVLQKRTKHLSLVTIGKCLNVTEARVRQIEKNAIRKVSAKNPQLSLFKK